MRKLLLTLISVVFLCVIAFSSMSTHAFAATANATGHNVSVQASGSGCPATLLPGNTGDLVAVLQDELNGNYDNGVYLEYPVNFHPPLNVDKQYGPLTTNAVKDFQFSQGLSTDGKVGPQTWHALGYC